MGFSKPKRELLLEETNGQLINVRSSLFLKLTVEPRDYERILKPVPPKQKADILNSKGPEFDIQRRALRLVPFSLEKIKQQPPELHLEPRGLDKQRGALIYQVETHHGRARNLANIYDSDNPEATLPAKLIFKDGKNLQELLSDTRGVLIQGQAGPGADNEFIGLKELIVQASTQNVSNASTQNVSNQGTDIVEILKTDPLQIGQQDEFNLYQINRPSIKSIQGTIENKFLNYRTKHRKELDSLGIADGNKFAEHLNNLYTIEVDNPGGQQYKFGYTKNMYFNSSGEPKEGGGMSFLNLVPHPYSLVKNQKELENQTYKIIKK